MTTGQLIDLVRELRNPLGCWCTLPPSLVPLSEDVVTITKHSNVCTLIQAYLKDKTIRKSRFLQDQRLFRCIKCSVCIVSDNTHGPIQCSCPICEHALYKSEVFSVCIVRDVREPLAMVPEVQHRQDSQE